MDLSQKIADYGADAVRFYARMAKLDYDNEVREEFASSWIARKLFENDGLTVHVEREYTRIIRDLKNEVTSTDISSMGGWRADIAIYGPDGSPLSIIEVKICDEGDRGGTAVLRDREKINVLSKRVKIDTYLAILLTDINDTNKCADRRQCLEKKLPGSFTGDSGAIRALNGEWEWQFLAGKW